MGVFVEIAIWGVAVFAAVYFIYLIFFSGHERLRKQISEQRNRHRFERREMERGDRRKEDAAPPTDSGERRMGRRR